MTTQPLRALPDRLIRRKFFDPEKAVRFLGWRPCLLALESERSIRADAGVAVG